MKWQVPTYVNDIEARQHTTYSISEVTGPKVHVHSTRGHCIPSHFSALRCAELALLPDSLPTSTDTLISFLLLSHQNHENTL